VTLRNTKGSALSYTELDTNFTNLKDATVSLTAGSGGTQVTADLNGNITLIAGSGVTLTGDNTAKTVTITNASLGANAFGKIVVAGQSDVDADATSDALTLAAGSNITLTTNASTDTVTIASTVTGLTNPLNQDLDLSNYVIKDTNSVATIQSSGLMVKSNTYANAELTITPGDNANVVSRISTKEGDLAINTNDGGIPQASLLLEADGKYIHLHSSDSDFYVLVGDNSAGTGVIRLFPMTTAERNARTTVSNGMMIYNESTHKFQGYANGVWVDLH
jgi:hypothetical protein